MSGYPLRALLEQRRRDEDAAALEVANAATQRAQAEAEAARMDGEVEAAEERLRSARVTDDFLAAGAANRRPVQTSGADALSHEQFVARLRGDLSRARSRRAAFRSGPLRDACAAEDDARGHHLAARQAREALDKHEARFQQDARRLADRREEDALEDAARAARHLSRARDS